MFYKSMQLPPDSHKQIQSMEHPQYAECAVQPGREVKHQQTGEEDPVNQSVNLVHVQCMLYIRCCSSE